MKNFRYNGKFKLCKLCANVSCEVDCEIIQEGLRLRDSGDLEFEMIKKRESEKAERKRLRAEARKELGLISGNDDQSVIEREKQKEERKNKRYLARLELGLIDLSRKVILTQFERECFRVRETENPLIDIVRMDFGRGEHEYYRQYAERADGRFDVVIHKSEMNLVNKSTGEKK